MTNLPSEKHVLILLPYVNRYREQLLRDLSASLSENGVRLRVAAGKASGVDAQRADQSSTFAPILLPQFEIPLVGKRLLLRVPPRGWLGSDLVIVEHAIRNLETYLIVLGRNLFRRKTAIWGHGMTITEPQSEGQRKVQRWLLRRTQWLFAYTEESARRGIAGGARAGSTTVLYNTFDTARLRELIEATRLPARDRWVGVYIGGLDESKRIDLLLASAKATYDLDQRFLLVVGGRGALEGAVSKLASEPWLEYVGAADDATKARLAHEAQVMLVPGRVGLAAIDSFVMGAPIVTTRWPFHAPEFEYLNEGNSVVTDNDQESYVNAIVELMRSPERLASLKSSAHKSASLYPISRMVDQFSLGIVEALATKRYGSRSE